MQIQVKRLFEQVLGRFSLIVSPIKILKSDGVTAKAQFLHGEVVDKVPITTPYGFKSNPPAGYKALTVSNGDRLTAVMITCDNGKKPIPEDKIAIFNSKTDILTLVESLIGTLVNSTVDTPQGPAQFSVVAKKNLEIEKKKWGQLFESM